jgi:hypothetical protein
MSEAGRTSLSRLAFRNASIDDKLIVRRASPACQSVGGAFLMQGQRKARAPP